MRLVILALLTILPAISHSAEAPDARHHARQVGVLRVLEDPALRESALARVLRDTALDPRIELVVAAQPLAQATRGEGGEHDDGHRDLAHR